MMTNIIGSIRNHNRPILVKEDMVFRMEDLWVGPEEGASLSFGFKGYRWGAGSRLIEVEI